MDTPFNVLSLEDSDPDFEIISEQLVKAGYNLKISRAETENEFTSLICNNRFDIILADYNLPQFDAFEALKICNLRCPDVPFICVSGSIGEIMAIELLKMGAVDYVIKDRLERLPFAVKRALEEAKEKNALKLAEEELKKKEINYRTLTENIPDIITRFDKDLRHLYINPAIEKVSGLRASDYIGKTNEELGMPVEKVVVWNQHMHQAFETAEQQTFEFDFETPDGIRYFSSLIVPELNEDGRVDSILIVARDISEHKLAEIALKKSEERLRDIIFSTADWVWEVDEQGRYTYSSQRDIDLFDVAPDEIIGKTPFDFMPAEEAKRIAAIFSDIVSNKLPIKDLENWNIGKDGNPVCLLTNGLPILDYEGKLMGYRGVDKNITERKHAEQELITAKEKAEVSDRLKTAFINNISHEIRTPLNGILGFGQFLADSELTIEERSEYYALLRQSSNRLTNTVSDYIDMARIVSGTMEVHQKNFLLQPLFKEIIENTKLLCAEKKIGFEAVIPTEPANITLFSDGEFIRRTVNILLDNALKFTMEGSINCGYVITLGYLECFVQDTGVGIAPDKIEIIFDMFSQEDASTTRGYDGSGLGLTIAKGLVKLLGGTIQVVSEKGKGSIFTFTVPYKVPAQSETPSITKTRESNDIRKQLVLIAEDEESNYMYMQVVMKMIGCKHIHAVNGAEAVEMCKQNKEITLVLMDIKMPVMNGLEATQLIHEFRPELPIIATTAYAQTGDEHRFLEAGCDGFLPKPVKKDTLTALLQKYILI